MSSPLSLFFLTISLLILNTFPVYNTELIDEKVAGFSYSGGNGPNRWGGISPKFSACSKGKMQSPIDIVKHKASPDKKLKPLNRDYRPVNATLVNNGFNVGIHFEGNAGGFNLDGKNYNMIQMHWHSPSEHRIDGHLCDAELHMVHKTDDGRISVVGILYKYGAADPLLAKIGSKLAELGKEKYASSEQAHIEIGSLDPRQMRKTIRKYYRYTGSFTTPPCSENVIWNILAKVRSISKQQVEALKAPLDSAYKNNSRPLQALNGRQVMVYDESNNV